MDTALARLREQTEPQIWRRHPSKPSALRPGDIIDLARICAVHDKPYAARYIADSAGRFSHSQTIRVTEALYLEQYADGGDTLALQSDDLAEEFCPWCGGHGRGSIRCATCRREICFGRTTGRYFRCRASCGGQGTMVSQARTHAGVRPGSSPKNGFSTE
jgi:hypothetical protein